MNNFFKMMMILIVMEARADIMEKITVESSAFRYGEAIPKKYTCDGANINPPLSWASHTLPVNCKSIVVICYDPDAPSGTFVHWVVFNIPATVTELPEKVSIASLGGIEGTNSYTKQQYDGPCPPKGMHHYYFHVYALDIDTLSLTKTATAQEVDSAMKDHIIMQGELMGTYAR